MTTPSSPPRFQGVRISATDVDTGSEEYDRRPELAGHLATTTFLELTRDLSRVVVIDNHPQRRAFTAGTLLAVSIALSRRWRKSLSGTRIGVALPPGFGAFVANVGLTFAGKIPVNLNFTAGPAAATASMLKAGIDTVLSAPALQEKLPDFPWPARTLDIRAEIEACGKPAIVGWLLAMRLLPARWLARRLALPERGGDSEATLLFTSGSSGEPKGVVLTHRNIIGNARQVAETGAIRRGDTMLGCLPVFHSFGFTVTLWYPLLHGACVATFPTPLETRRLAEIIAAEKADVLIGAPTFLRPFLKRADPDQMRTLRLVVAGAEKLPQDLADGFQERFGIPICEGYGLTETSPVLALNRPDPFPLVSGGEGRAWKSGSVGLLVPGIRAKLVDPATLETVPTTATGLLAVKGCNIFGGYLDDPAANSAAFREGWFVTGDLARFDESGYLHIEGRLSRFSKIGGEMVPHATVEQKIIEAFGLQGAEMQPVVVTGVPDGAKGEALVVLTTEDIPVAAMREKLAAAGLPNLWIPKRITRVPAIPTLRTGKLDLRTCRQVAEGGGGKTGGG